MKVLNYPFMQMNATGNKSTDNTPNCRVRAAHQKSFQVLDRDTVMFGMSVENAEKLLEGLKPGYSLKSLSRIVDAVETVGKTTARKKMKHMSEEEINDILKLVGKKTTFKKSYGEVG